MIINPPLAVTLASFAAQGQADRVVVSWETLSEANNAGFNVYRADNAAGPQTLLAYVPSQAPGSTQGFAYSYDDLAVQPGQTYWYWLEDVSLSGATTLHGPVSATVQRADGGDADRHQRKSGGRAGCAALAAGGGRKRRRRAGGSAQTTVSLKRPAPDLTKTPALSHRPGFLLGQALAALSEPFDSTGWWRYTLDGLIGGIHYDHQDG